MGEPIREYKEQRCVFGGPDPGKPAPGIMQVFYEGEEPAFVDFICPCGCGNTCPTPVRKSAEPKKPHHWQISIGPNGITLSPSIRWLSGCKAHFNITDGKAVMHGDSGK